MNPGACIRTARAEVLALGGRLLRRSGAHEVYVIPGRGLVILSAHPGHWRNPRAMKHWRATLRRTVR